MFQIVVYGDVMVLLCPSTTSTVWVLEQKKEFFEQLGGDLGTEKNTSSVDSWEILLKELRSFIVSYHLFGVG